MHAFKMRYKQLSDNRVYVVYKDVRMGNTGNRRLGDDDSWEVYEKGLEWETENGEVWLVED